MQARLNSALAACRPVVEGAARMLPAACALAGGVMLLLTLVLLPGAFSAAHALAVGGTALVLAAFLMRNRLSSLESDTYSAGNLSALSALSKNIQERIERLQDLQWQASERETRYRALLDAQSNLILRVDHKRRLTFGNRAYCALFGVEADDVLGRPFSPEVVSGNSCFDGRPWPLANAADCRPLEQLIATPHGERWISWRIHELAPDGSGLFEYELVGRDVTLERAQEASLEEARQQAETANRAKSRFLAAMSHEIRTPMNGILGMTGLLWETKLSEEQQTYVSAIEQSASTLLGLIDEILDFSKIEAGKLTLKEERFSILDCVRSTVELLAPNAHEKGLELAWRMEPDVPEHLFGDMSRVRQVVLNLLSNAIKFTEKGGVEVTIAATESRTGAQHSEGSRRISIAVRDTGIGLSDEDAATLFEEFEQSKATAGGQSGGTGLGLAISRRLARAMGGDIGVVSRLGEGSSFTAELDLRDAGGDDPALIADRPEAMGQRVLLASDKLIERSTLARILSDNGALPVEVSSGAAFEAITTARQRGEGFDCLIVDCALLPEDAQKLYEHASACDYPVPVGIVMMSVDARGRLDAYRSAGFDRYLIRPVRPRSLIEQVARPRSRSRPAPSDLAELPMQKVVSGSARVPGNERAGRLRRRLVMIVEDNEINALLTVKVVERAGHKALLMRNGRAAVDHMCCALQGAARMPDAILMDIFMPDLDGVETSRRIKALFRVGGDVAPAGTCPPIIALTAHAFNDDRDRFLEAGLDDCLIKPFVPTDLHRVLEDAFRDAENSQGTAA